MYRSSFAMTSLGLLLAISSLASAAKPVETPAEIAEKARRRTLDLNISRNYFLSLAGFALLVILYRVISLAVQHQRTLACLSTHTQNYFTIPSHQWGRFKSTVLLAPLFRTRHNREFKLSSAVNMGTLPSRFQSLFIVAIVATNVVLCVYRIPMDAPMQKVLGIVKNRTGTISVANLIPMVVLAGRNNPLIPWLNISFDSFNMMHRWLGRLAILEAIAHMSCWMIAKVDIAGWSVVQASITSSTFIMTGLIAVVAFVAILFQSPSPIRHAFYETFLHLHIALVILSFVALWIHLAGYPQQAMLVTAVALWIFERGMRLLSLIYRNLGRERTKATIEPLAGDAIRVSLKLPRPWRVRPGQHVYLTIPAIGIWTSHPFSVAWSDTSLPFDRTLEVDEKGFNQQTTYQDLHRLKPNTISVIIRRRTGFTDTLYKHALAKANASNKITLTAFVEGPYGLCQPLHSYGTVVLVAAGIGITHHLPYIRHLTSAYERSGTIATRRVTLIWIVQRSDHLQWIQPYMTQILAMPKRREVLNIKLFVTQPANADEISSPSYTVQIFPGRPCVDSLLERECEKQVGAMVVSVCGVGALGDEVRKAVRTRQSWNNIDLVEESFTW